MMTRQLIFAVSLLALAPVPCVAQEFDGIVVLGKAKAAVQQARLELQTSKGDVIDTTRTDVFGGFRLKAPAAGKYSILVRRTGYLPVLTERFELAEGEVRTDTVFLEGRQAERGIKDVISDNVRQVFGSSLLTTFWRYAGPEDIDPVRSKFNSLGDFVRGGGKMLGLQHVNPPGGCFRFSGQRGCAQLFFNGIAVTLSPDQVSVRELEAVVALRPEEIGSAVTRNRLLDTSRYGAVLVYTSAFVYR